MQPDETRETDDLPQAPASADGPLGADEPVRRPGDIPPALLDPHALTVVRRLRRFGHEAYLVGGCVRDLLCGLEPKDFDVVTDARPNRIKRLFRNARIIGRRFRLAHIRFGPDHVIETSTYRRAPGEGEADEGREDEPDPPRTPEERPAGRRRPARAEGGPAFGPENVFGTAPEDARRRDFTINALFYDPLAGEILDWVGGLDDLEARIIRSIGDPDHRLREDPVRMIRAVHFEQRMGFTLEPHLEAAIRNAAPLLGEASQARLYVELIKVLLRGRARSSLARLQALGVLRYWLPELAGALSEEGTWPERAGGSDAEAQEGEPDVLPVGHATWNLLGAADRWGPGAHDAEESVALAPLLGPWLLDAWRREGSPHSHLRFAEIVDGRLRPLALRMSMPRRVQARLRDLLWVWLEIQHPPRRGRALPRLVRRPAFPLALSYLRLDLMARDRSPDVLEAWQAIAPPLPVSGDRPPRESPPPRARSTKHRGRGRGRERDRDGGGPPIGSEADAWAPAPRPAEEGQGDRPSPEAGGSERRGRRRRGRRRRGGGDPD